MYRTYAQQHLCAVAELLMWGLKFSWSSHESGMWAGYCSCVPLQASSTHMLLHGELDLARVATICTWATAQLRHQLHLVRVVHISVGQQVGLLVPELTAPLALAPRLLLGGRVQFSLSQCPCSSPVPIKHFTPNRLHPSRLVRGLRERHRVPQTVHTRIACVCLDHDRCASPAIPTTTTQPATRQILSYAYPPCVLLSANTHPTPT